MRKRIRFPRFDFEEYAIKQTQRAHVSGFLFGFTVGALAAVSVLCVVMFVVTR